MIIPSVCVVVIARNHEDTRRRINARRKKPDERPKTVQTEIRITAAIKCINLRRGGLFISIIVNIESRGGGRIRANFLTAIQGT